MLCRLGLDLGRCRNVRNQRQVHIDNTIVTELDAHLAYCLEKWQGFDVANSSADFNEANISTACAALDTLLDLIGDVWNDLYSRAQIVAAALLGDDCLVDAPGREITVAPGRRSYETFIMAKIEVSLGSVMRDEHLTVLKRTHRARINIDVGIQLDHAD